MTGIPFTKIKKADYTALIPETPHEVMPYPPALRHQLAALDLQGKREDSPEAVALIQAAQERLNLDGSWEMGPCPIPRMNNPTGTNSVWWRMV